MRKLRDASFAEVLAATPNDKATRAVTEKHQPFEVWLLEGADDFGRVRMQLPTGELGTIVHLHAQFLAWVEAPERTPEERARYWDRYADIEGGEHVHWPRSIVLGPEQQVHDGRHRLMAAYSHPMAGRHVSLEVF